MIFGLFDGKTVEALKGQKLKIQAMEDQFVKNKDQAIADRTAAIEELKKDLDAIAAL